MSYDVRIHDAQLAILRELLFHPSSNYATLQRPTGMTSDHFNFHIARLVELGLVERVEKGRYRLSIAGKEYANKLDTDNNTVERQPKVAVLLAIWQGSGNERKLLVQQRIKNPNYGFYGFPTGKIRWGETIVQAAERECREETGLIAKFIVKGVHHEQVLFRDGELIEDKIFFICEAVSYQGELQDEFEGGKNQWMSVDEFKSAGKTFAGLESELAMLRGEGDWLAEIETYYDRELF